MLKWERGEAAPTIKTLETIADSYKRPLAVLYLSEPPSEPATPPDFRTLASETPLPLTLKTLLSIRKARRFLSIVSDLREEGVKVKLAELPVLDLGGDAEKIAVGERECLGVTADMQRRFADPGEALTGLISLVEGVEICVFQQSMPVEETRAFSLTDGDIPAVVLNLKDSPRARLFSLFHEYAHIRLKNGGICGAMEDVGARSAGHLNIEQFCNRFAGAFLVPEYVLRDLVAKAGRVREWTDELLGGFASHFKVSSEVVLRRLVILGYASPGLYAAKRAEWARRPPKPPPKWGPSPAQRCLSERGTTFVNLALDALGKGGISHSDIADYLGIRLKHLGEVESLVRRKGIVRHG